MYARLNDNDTSLFLNISEVTGSFSLPLVHNSAESTFELVEGFYQFICRVGFLGVAYVSVDRVANNILPHDDLTFISE